MAISVQDNRLVVVCSYEGSGYNEAYQRIIALLNILSSVTDDNMLRPEDVYFICSLIQDLLPDARDFDILEQMKYPRHPIKM